MYYAVIFTSIRTEVEDGYGEMASRMEVLAQAQPGYLGMESFSNAQGLRVTISYWQEEAHLIAWKKQVEHREAQRLGQERWYQWYKLEVCKVERAYQFGNR